MRASRGFWLALTIVLSAGAQGLAAEPAASGSIAAPAFIDRPVLTDNRLSLLREYARIHFPSESIALVDPQIIVIHYTTAAGLGPSLAAFEGDYLPADRREIAGHGDVNVGVHYLIAKNGAIFRLQPEDVVGRHVIGFNHRSIGIEMVAAGAADLSAAELDACAALSAWIASRHPSIRYLIGHHEYMNRALPHFALYYEKDAGYSPTKKDDPGPEFMERLRAKLADEWSLVFED